jgi:hypothetical protein
VEVHWQALDIDQLAASADPDMARTAVLEDVDTAEDFAERRALDDDRAALDTAD